MHSKPPSRMHSTESCHSRCIVRYTPAPIATVPTNKLHTSVAETPALVPCSRTCFMRRPAALVEFVPELPAPVAFADVAPLPPEVTAAVASAASNAEVGAPATTLALSVAEVMLADS
jgi:hypothetical protein